MRESCIQHRPGQPMAIARLDYLELTGDGVATLLLNEFEHRANAALIKTPGLQSINVGRISIAEFEYACVGLTTDKQIRKRLKFLEDEGFISVVKSCDRGKSPEYIFHIQKTQVRLNDLGQITELTSVKQPNSVRSNNRSSSVKQPNSVRSNNRASIYKKYLEKEDLSREQSARKVQFPQSENPVPLSESSSVNLETSVEQQPLERDARAAAPRFVPAAPPSSAARCDRSFQQLPWGSWSNPEQGFLDWLVKNHLPFVSGYKERPQITDNHAKSWLIEARRHEGRWEQANLKYEEYSEQRDRPKAAYAPAPAEPMPLERQKPNLEAVRRARQLAGLRVEEVHHAS